MRARDPRVLKRRSIAESFRIAASYAAAPRPPKSLPEDSGQERKPANPGARGRHVATAMLSRDSIGAGTNESKVAPASANNVLLWRPTRSADCFGMTSPLAAGRSTSTLPDPLQCA